MLTERPRGVGMRVVLLRDMKRCWPNEVRAGDEAPDVMPLDNIVVLPEPSCESVKKQRVITAASVTVYVARDDAVFRKG